MVSRARNQPDLTSPGGPPLIEFSCFGVARRLPICAAGLIDAPSRPLRGLLGLPAPPRAAGVHSCVRGEGRDRQVGLVRVVGAIHRSHEEGLRPGRGAHLRVGGPAASAVRPDGLAVDPYRAGSHPCVRYARHTLRVALKI